MSDIYKEFGVDVLRDSENAGPTSAEVRMAQEIARFRAENIHLRRAGMDRPSAELHEAALAELRDQISNLRAEVMEQARLLGMSGEREAKLLARVEKLEKVRAAARFLINEDAGVDDPAEDGWWEWEKNCEALRAALKEAKP
jgi:hypothetical protein